MARTLKTNGIYNIKCTLTAEPAGTTPAVFAARAGRYGVTVDVLKQNYVGRTGAKLLKTLVNEQGLKPADAITKIRSSFKVEATKPIADAVVNKILATVSAKAKKAKDAGEFEARKKAALKALLTPAPTATESEPAKTATK